MGIKGKIVALVVAAGSGSRAGGGMPKQYRQIGGRPLLAHTIDHLKHDRIDIIQIVIGEGQEGLFHHAVGHRSLPSPTVGGATRQQSVRNGLEALAAKGGVGAVLIHDAARPFLPPDVIERLIEALDAADGAVRSEEHTSELQSLMRISYAVFCLKKKITYKTKTTS